MNNIGPHGYKLVTQGVSSIESMVKESSHIYLSLIADVG